MRTLDALLAIQAEAPSCSGVFTGHDLAALLSEENGSKRLDATIHRLVGGGHLERVRRGLFLHPPAADAYALHRIAGALTGGRPAVVSLESGASAWGLTTQTFPRYLSVVSTAPSARVTCSEGIVEVMHTTMPGTALLEGSVDDGTPRLPLARKDLVIHNLRRSGRDTILEEGA